MDQYVTITNTIGEGFYTEKRSKFLAFAHHVETIDEAKAVVAHYKAKYYDARHCCFAYVLGPERDTYRAFDDGEPSSTAGRPILGQINSFEVTDIIIVVVRYYGGVNLGTGRLTQAYKLAAQDAMNHTKREVRTIEEKIVYQFAYANFSAVMRVVHDMQARIINQDLVINALFVWQCLGHVLKSLINGFMSWTILMIRRANRRRRRTWKAAIMARNDRVERKIIVTENREADLLHIQQVRFL